MSTVDRAHFSACLQPIPNTREALLSSIQPFLHLTQKKIWHRVPPFLHRYYNIYKVRFVQIFQFLQIQPYNILFICQMPLTLPQRSSFLIVRDIVCRSPIGRTLWSNIRIVDWRWAISASTHRSESLIGLSKEPNVETDIRLKNIYFSYNNSVWYLSQQSFRRS